MFGLGFWRFFVGGYETPLDCHRFFKFFLFVMSFADNNAGSPSFLFYSGK